MKTFANFVHSCNYILSKPKFVQNKTTRITTKMLAVSSSFNHYNTWFQTSNDEPSQFIKYRTTTVQTKRSTNLLR